MVLVYTTMNTNRYSRMLDDYMMPFIDESYPWLNFQQGNTAPHRVNVTNKHSMENTDGCGLAIGSERPSQVATVLLA